MFCLITLNVCSVIHLLYFLLCDRGTKGPFRCTPYMYSQCMCAQQHYRIACLAYGLGSFQNRVRLSGVTEMLTSHIIVLSLTADIQIYMCLCICCSRSALDTPYWTANMGDNQNKAHMAICLLGSGDRTMRINGRKMHAALHSIVIANSSVP